MDNANGVRLRFSSRLAREKGCPFVQTHGLDTGSEEGGMVYGTPKHYASLLHSSSTIRGTGDIIGCGCRIYWRSMRPRLLLAFVCGMASNWIIGRQACCIEVALNGAGGGGDWSLWWLSAAGSPHPTIIHEAEIWDTPLVSTPLCFVI